MYKHPRIPMPDQEALAKINVREDKEAAHAYLRDIRDHVNQVAADIEEMRKALSVAARGPEVTMRKLRQVASEVPYAEGWHDGAKQIYGTALGGVCHRDDLDLNMVHMLVWMDFMENWARVANDDSWSGLGNDDRRRYRDGYWRAMDRIKYLPNVPNLRFPKPERADPKDWPAERKVEIITAMGFTPTGSDHQPDCPYALDAGNRCNCIPPPIEYTPPPDVQVILQDTWEDRRERAKKPRPIPDVER